MSDLKFAWRMLLKYPGFTAVAVLTLALGIGANTAAFSWVQTVLLRTIPGVEAPTRLVVLAPRYLGGRLRDTMSYPDLEDLGRRRKIFSGVIGSQMAPMSLQVGSSQPQWLWGQAVTANFFHVLGVSAERGRTFLPEEGAHPGGEPVVVISHGLWRRAFNEDPSAVGRLVRLNGHPFTIVGVAPPDFRGTVGGLRFDLWVPVTMRAEVLPGQGSPDVFHLRGNYWLHTIARLAPGVPLRRARAALDAISRTWEEEYPASHRNLRFAVVPLWQSPWGAQGILLPLLSVLFAVTVLVLAIVAANLANLLLARATGRSREMAVRLSLGASRPRLIRQLLTESIVLSLGGGLIGIPCAIWLIHSSRGLFPTLYLPVALDPYLDWRGLVFMLAASVGTGVLFGLAPAWQLSRPNLSATLKEGGRGVLSRRHGLRAVLAAFEVGLALLLLIGAGLCVQSFRHARTADYGFDPDHVLVANLRLGVYGYSKADGERFDRAVLERLRGLPGVRSVALADYVPLGPEGGSSTRVRAEGYVPQPSEDMSFAYDIVSPGYFDTMRIPLVQGRDFNWRDDGSASGVVIINQTLARRFWPGQNPVGRRFTIFGDRTLTVVGVAKNTKYRRLNEPATGFFYLPLTQVYTPNVDIHLRAAGPPLAMADAVRRAVKALDPAVQPAIIAPMSQIIDFALMNFRAAASVLTALGGTALFLAVIGIYGVMAFVQSQRTQEIGIRMALGAGKGEVLRLILGQGARLAAYGMALGLAGALALTRFLSRLLVGITALDPLSFAGATLFLFLVALVACYLPARRAARVSPTEALRYE